MASNIGSGKLRNMLDMKLTVGQVLAGSFVTVTTVVSTMIYVQSTYETKSDAAVKQAQVEAWKTKIETGMDNQTKVQTEIYGDVKEIHGILRAQMAEKSARGGR